MIAVVPNPGPAAETPGTRKRISLASWALRVSAVSVLACAWLAGSLSGCGYVLVKVTPPAATLTPTPPVLLITPGSHATSTPVPSTPLPTATPTATPTPVVYVVQKGDNLLAIADQYGVSVYALIDANGIENPRALQVGQQLIIPLGEADILTAQPSATPTPVTLNVVHLGFHRTPVGSLWCMGDVQNDRDEALELVQIQAFLYNADGERVGQASGFTAAEIVPAHGKAPFALLFPHPPASGFAGYEVLVLSAEPVTHWGNRHRGLVVEEVTGAADGSAVAVQGIVHNQDEASAREVRVLVTAYGQEGEVVGVRQVELAGLEAGERQAFSVSLIPAAPAVRVEAVAWGTRETPAD
jgi:LysM repeat protein